MKHLTVVLVRVQGLVVLLYGLVSATYLPAYLRDFRASVGNPDAHEAAHIALVGSLLRMALYLAGGLLLYGRAGQIVGRLAPRQGDAPAGADPGAGD